MKSRLAPRLALAGLLLAGSGQADPPAKREAPAGTDEAPAQAPAPLLPGDAPPELPSEPSAPSSAAPPKAPAPTKASAPPAKTAKPPATEQGLARTRQDSAHVQLYVDFPGAWLELSSLIDDRGFQRVCPAPCDIPLRVSATEARVSAPGMTPSNPFRIEPGSGTAQFRVDGGSAATRRWGILSLSVGIPVALIGGGIWGYGRVEESKPLQITGIAVLSTGALAILGSLPLLSMGATRVRDARGSVIARRRHALPAF
ncbi:MAG: hypothetical protein R3B13_28490 [Polyangiaceae bacterium]